MAQEAWLGVDREGVELGQAELLAKRKRGPLSSSSCSLPPLPALPPPLHSLQLQLPHCTSAQQAQDLPTAPHLCQMLSPSRELLSTYSISCGAITHSSTHPAWALETLPQSKEWPAFLSSPAGLTVFSAARSFPGPDLEILFTLRGSVGSP
jgi:hypothetical protein